MADEFKDVFIVCELNYIHLYDDEDKCLIFVAQYDSLDEAEQYIKETKSTAGPLYILPLKQYNGPEL